MLGGGCSGCVVLYGRGFGILRLVLEGDMLTGQPWCIGCQMGGDVRVGVVCWYTLG